MERSSVLNRKVSERSVGDILQQILAVSSMRSRGKGCEALQKLGREAGRRHPEILRARSMTK
jgi:hypothetical protein